MKINLSILPEKQDPFYPYAFEIVPFWKEMARDVAPHVLQLSCFFLLGMVVALAFVLLLVHEAVF